MYVDCVTVLNSKHVQAANDTKLNINLEVFYAFLCLIQLPYLQATLLSFPVEKGRAGHA